MQPKGKVDRGRMILAEDPSSRRPRTPPTPDVHPDAPPAGRAAAALPPRSRPRTPIPRPHPPAARRGPTLDRHPGHPLLQLPHHRPLAQTLPGRGRRGPDREEARPPLSLRRRLDRRRPDLGHATLPPRLRLPAQPLGLRDDRPAAAEDPPAPRQPRDGPALAASRRLGLPPTPPGRRPDRPRIPGEARRLAPAPGRVARRRGG